ncbi:hypothetical protein RJ639_047408 [Escallonia herrerae]|uniref:Uncharacterized protein n=1 Tax=Escallonia herrerae TaxID=1293975 RepID=A0AA88W9Q9_9ASTE|nr:hypothetical protein RJ639_047408 [Escallonia herrerae]
MVAFAPSGAPTMAEVALAAFLPLGKSVRAILSKLSFAVTCYSIWEERNPRVFTGKIYRV